MVSKLFISKLKGVRQSSSDKDQMVTDLIRVRNYIRKKYQVASIDHMVMERMEDQMARINPRYVPCHG
jgi:ribosomal protein S3